MNWEFKHVLREEKFENFREMNITGILFNKEILANEELKFQTLREVCFQNVKFVSCVWDNVFLAKVRFVNCEFLNTSIVEANFNKVEFVNCKFKDVNFDNTFLVKVEFINCEFLNTNFIECNFSKVRFTNCKLTNASIYETKVSETQFLEGVIQYSKWENIDFEGKFDRVILRENIYRHSKFINTDFFYCEFSLENFIDTKISKCDLKTCSFKEININIDDLIGSKLSVLNLLSLINDKGIIIED